MPTKMKKKFGNYSGSMEELYFLISITGLSKPMEYDDGSC
jgi:hypothetical protein